MLSEIGKLLIGVGLLMTAVGLILTFLPSIRLGRLPGDILIRRGTWNLYLPIASSLLVSLFLSLLLWLLFSLRK
ncbi:MAG: DUF2905 domain-containing protein [Acidobacteriota bacterium]